MCAYVVLLNTSASRYILGLGGTIAFADLQTKTSIAVTVNALSLTKEAVNQVVKLLCAELRMGEPVDFD